MNTANSVANVSRPASRSGSGSGLALVSTEGGAVDSGTVAGGSAEEPRGGAGDGAVGGGASEGLESHVAGTDGAADTGRSNSRPGTSASQGSNQGSIGGGSSIGGDSISGMGGGLLDKYEEKVAVVCPSGLHFFHSRKATLPR